MKIARKFIVKGRVQGVGFRYFTEKVANKIGVTGYVRNLYDGSVEVYAIGSAHQMSNLKNYLLKGPSYGRVDNIFEEDEQILNYSTFTVKY